MVNHSEFTVYNVHLTVDGSLVYGIWCVHGVWYRL